MLKKNQHPFMLLKLLYFFQFEIAKLEQVKESMTRELVLLSEQNEQHEMKLSKLESVEQEYKVNTLIIHIDFN